MTMTATIYKTKYFTQLYTFLLEEIKYTEINEEFKMAILGNRCQKVSMFFNELYNVKIYFYLNGE